MGGNLNFVTSTYASAGTKLEFSAPCSLPHLLHGRRVWLCLNMMLWWGHGELLFPRSRWNTVYRSTVAQTWALNTCKHGYRGRVSMMHSWSSDIVPTIYMHTEVEAGESGSGAGVLGKAASLTPAGRGCRGVGLPFAGQWESSPQRLLWSLVAWEECFALRQRFCVWFGENVKANLRVLYKQKQRYARACGLRRGWCEERLGACWKLEGVAMPSTWMPWKSHLASCPAMVCGPDAGAWLVPSGGDYQLPGEVRWVSSLQVTHSTCHEPKPNVLQLFNHKPCLGAS